MAKTNKNVAKSGVSGLRPAVSPFCPKNNGLDDLRAFGDDLTICEKRLANYIGKFIPALCAAYNQ